MLESSPLPRLDPSSWTETPVAGEDRARRMRTGHESHQPWLVRRFLGDCPSFYGDPEGGNEGERSRFDRSC
jgi:hypothetical protein